MSVEQHKFCCGSLGCPFPCTGEAQGGWLLPRDVSIWTTGLASSHIYVLLYWNFLFPPFLYRSKVFTYDEVVEKVAEKLGIDDPSKIRLTSHNCYSQQPKPQPIKYRGVDRLLDMLIHYNQVMTLWLLIYITISCLAAKQKITYLLTFHVTDFWYSLLWSIGYTPSRITGLEDTKSYISSCHKRWGYFLGLF